LKEILQPAITLAEEGFPVSSITAHAWSQEINPFFAHKKNPDKDDFFINGQAPNAGDVMKMPHLAETFRVNTKYFSYNSQYATLDLECPYLAPPRTLPPGI
jgi:gamma-glutamyltranspeptidase